MNFRTTLWLAVVLVGLAAVYLWRPPPEDAATTTTSPRPTDASSVARDVIDPKLEDIVKIVCKRKGNEEWVFEKESDSDDTGPSQWRLTSPVEMKVVSWEVDRFGGQLGRLQYEVSYKPGEPGAITAADAGLDPPEAVITLTDAEGRSVTVEVGKPAPGNSSYVRLAEGDEILVGTTSLHNLFKDSVLEYRDKQVWSFKSADVTRVEVIDRSKADAPVAYAFSKDGSQWMMESPVTAKATSKIDDVVTTLSRMRAVAWHDDKPERLAAYGLQPAAFTVRATVEEEIPVEAADEEPSSNDVEDAAAAEDEAEEEKAFETKLTVYELHLSDRSPIGEDTKVYMRVGDEPMVASVMKTTADKFTPAASEWREMRVTTANVAGATRVELSAAGSSAALLKRDGHWWFADGDQPAEDKIVEELLEAVGDLTAVAFVDGKVADEAKFGLDHPQAEIALTIPGVEDVERVTVGGYTDEKTKRLVYVRRNKVASVGKVRASGVAQLLRGTEDYRNRTIFNIPASRIERVALSRENQYADGRLELAIDGVVGAWAMTEPIKADVSGDKVDKLAESLGTLRAESIVAESGEPSAFGLHAPAVTVTFTHKPPVEYRFEKAERPAEPDGEGKKEDTEESGVSEKNEELVPVEVQAPSESLTLHVTSHDGRFYAKREDRPTIYAVSRDLFDKLRAEYHAEKLFSFDESSVREFSIRLDEDKHTFKRADDHWVYQTEPDLPLDQKKVNNLLLQVKGLQTKRYAVYAGEDRAAFGLAGGAREIAVKLDGGRERKLRVASQVCQRCPDGGFYAVLDADSGVFLLTEDDVRLVTVSLDDLEAAP
ncbi:MAG: DUF4340 domain-containing protein [Phycisphaerales bacterium]|nr:MAG: DUF4340 domain-containing protein [Phycisphaerales bacterium]